jgi:hypothetical protein
VDDLVEAEVREGPVNRRGIDGWKWRKNLFDA